MNFLRRLLGQNKPTHSSSGRSSYAKYLVEQKINMRTAECYICNSSFVAPEQFQTLVPVEAKGGNGDDISFRLMGIDEWAVDVGGFCIECLKLICHRHVIFTTVEIGDDQEIKKIAKVMHLGDVQGFRPACEECGNELMPAGSPDFLKLLNSPEGRQLLKDPATRQYFKQQLQK